MSLLPKTKGKKAGPKEKLGYNDRLGPVQSLGGHIEHMGVSWCLITNVMCEFQCGRDLALSL